MVSDAELAAVSQRVSPEGILYWAALLGEEDPRGCCDFDG
jgi:hypothetical protein